MTRRAGAAAPVTLLAFLLAWLWLAGGAAADDIDTAAAWPVCRDLAELPADAKTLVTIRATSALPDDAIRWIARYSVADVVTVGAGQSPEQKISERCGYFAETYWDELRARGLKENAGLERRQLTRPRQVALPGCVYWNNDVTVDVGPADTIDRLLSREVGLDGQQKLTDCESRGRDAKNRCDLTLRDLVQRRNPGRDLDNLGSSPKPLVLPLITRFSTINLRPECFADAAAAQAAFERVLQSGSGRGAYEWGHLAARWAGGGEFARESRNQTSSAGHETSLPLPNGPVFAQPPPTAEIARASPRAAPAPGDDAVTAAASPPHPAVVAVAPGGVMLLTEPLPAGRITSDVCRHAADTAKRNGTGWPFDAKEVADQLQSSFAIAERLERQTADLTGGDRYELGRPVIGIVDTGLSLNDPIVPLKDFGTARNCPPWNVHQCNLGYSIEGNLDFEPIYKYRHAWHGAQVADWVLGGASFRELVPVLVRKLRLRPYRIVKIMTVGTEQSIDIGQEGEILDIMRISAASQGVNIMNLSFGTPKPMDLLFNKYLVDEDTGPLMVVAAGNNRETGKDIKYPAAYGGNAKLRSTLITVAAHDAAFALADDFSARSGEIVDIAAPGCQLSWPMSEGQRKALAPNDFYAETNLFGTSFAAPPVTFTAGLVNLLGIKKTNEIKYRIIISARHDMPTSQVRFGSRLDIVSAITLFEDQLFEKAPSGLNRHRGEIQFPSGGLCGGGELVRDSHTSFRPDGPENAKVLKYFVKNVEGKYAWQDDCKPKSEGVTLRQADGTEKSYLWSQVAEVVTRYRAPPDQ